ncbi:MAG: radical SAM protein [Armatimonadetes bacterium]|nr:radical SAM protein [Armatimonadota bacterium]NIM23428.1 radical SAM protein [Armatimonadota bacterium]NIM67293.1 radical SAM protein [Armatimonadota bacterium]NIM75791.1 radical SAM protein [Armatimonadota bacterium]NIN05479.1 radical SAM protein [Armatimonadota bacterium]
MIGFTKLLCGKATVSRALRQASGKQRKEPGLLQFTTADRPLVVWNMTARCNLRCIHCYGSAGENALKEELTTAEAETLIDNLAQMEVPVLLFSGGEPLLREDIYHLGEYAAKKGIRPVLSTNGILITKDVAEALKKAGFQYIGISIDGTAETHDRFRCREGAFAGAWEGLRRAREAGLRTGVRFTVTQDNVEDLPAVLDQAVDEKANRFCLYHLVYSGRGTEIAERDLSAPERRKMIEWLIDKTIELDRRGEEIEILTTDNHADGVFLYRVIEERDPSRLADIGELLTMHGGCSAGRKFANIDAKGDVHACQFWGHLSLGNVRDRPFSEIWRNPDHPLLCSLKEMQASLTGRCGECDYKTYCGGCRIRAEASHGNLWGADPACYLSDEEIKGNGA